jgi:hypothetical protein
VRNNDATSRLSWREFLLVNEAERELDGLSVGLSPAQYYILRFHDKCTPTRMLKAFVSIIISTLSAVVIAAIPSVYAAKCLFQGQVEEEDSISWSDLVTEHPTYVTKIWSVGTSIVLASIGVIAAVLAYRKWSKRRTLRRAYERLNGNTL